jgi:hypothetical protein
MSTHHSLIDTTLALVKKTTVLSAISYFDSQLALDLWIASVFDSIHDVHLAIGALFNCHSNSFSLPLANFDKLPDHLIAYILEFVVGDVSIFYRMIFALYFRQVCSRWNKIVLGSSTLIQGIFLNMWERPVPWKSIAHRSLDLVWFVSQNETCLKNLVSLHRIASKDSGSQVRSFHLIFDPSNEPRLRSKIDRMLKSYFHTSPFLALSHLELVHASLLTVPCLHLFPNLITLEVIQSDVPHVELHTGHTLPLKHLYCADVEIEPIDPEFVWQTPFLRLLRAAKNLSSLRITGLQYPSTVTAPGQIRFFRPSPFLVRMDVTITCSQSLFLVIDLLHWARRTLEEVNIYIRSGPGYFSPNEAFIFFHDKVKCTCALVFAGVMHLMLKL